MAIKIKDGANGTFKSAPCFQFDLLPALRAGRSVVTNIEGLMPLELIEKILGEKSPASPRLIRHFTCNDSGVRFWLGLFN